MNRVGRLAFGLFLAILSVAGFASTFVFGAALTKLQGVSPLVLTFLRFLIADLILFVAGCCRPAERTRFFSLSRKDWLKMVWVAPIGTFLMAWSVFMGCARVSAANASMADALTPLMIFVVSAFHVRHIELKELIGLAFGFVGALLVIQILTGSGFHLSSYSVGDCYVLLAAATWGVYTVFGRGMVARMGSWAFSAWSMLIGAAVAAAFLPFGDFDWPTTVKGWGLVLGLGFCGTLLPFLMWNAAQRYLPMSVLGISAYFTPVFAVWFAALFLDESATLLQWVGVLFIAISAIVETGRTRGRRGC